MYYTKTYYYLNKFDYYFNQFYYLKYTIAIHNLDT